MFTWICRLWTKLWFEEIAPYRLAALRIAFGVYVLWYFLEYLFIVELAFSDQGVYSPYLIGDIAPPPLYAHLIYGVTLLSIVSLILGWHTRIAAVLVFVLFEYHHHLNFFVGNTTYDRITVIVLFILCFVRSGVVWSLDARRRVVTPLIPAWQIRLLQFQLSAVYFGSGIWKLLNPVWHSGEILKYSMASSWSSPLAFYILNLGLPDWVYSSLTWAVIVFELVAGFTLYFRKTRPATIVLGTIFHTSVAVILLIPGFLNCVAMYPLFIDFRAGRRESDDGHLAERSTGR